MKTPVAMVFTVGGSPDPICHAIEQFIPERVYFLCSTGIAGSDRGVDEAITEIRKENCPHCGKTIERRIEHLAIAYQASLRGGTYRIVRIDNPDSLAGVYKACEEVTTLIAEDFQDKAVRVVANYTGGTKTMSLGLGAYALWTAGRWEVQCNVSARGRKDLVKITRGDIPIIQEVADFHLDAGVKLARELENRHDYEGAIRVLMSLQADSLNTSHQDKLLELGTWQARLHVKSSWDRFEHPEALQRASDEPDIDKMQIKMLKNLKRSATLLGDTAESWGPMDLPGTDLVEDLAENARRCAKRQRFDDAVARLYRATEMLAQIKLRRDYGLNTGDIEMPSGCVSEQTHEWLGERRNERTGKVQIGLFDAYTLLADLGDPLGRFFEDRKNELLAFLDVRNHSILAHGLNPVGPQAWKVKGEAWMTWLQDATAVAHNRLPGVNASARSPT